MYRHNLELLVIWFNVGIGGVGRTYIVNKGPHKYRSTCLCVLGLKPATEVTCFVFFKSPIRC